MVDEIEVTIEDEDLVVEVDSDTTTVLVADDGDLVITQRDDADFVVSIPTIVGVPGAQGEQGEPGEGGGAETFLELTDTPSSYTSQGGKFVRVETSSPNELVFFDLFGTANTWTASQTIQGDLNIDTNTIIYDDNSQGTIFRLATATQWTWHDATGGLDRAILDRATGNFEVTGDLESGDDVIVGDDILFSDGAILNFGAGDVTITYTSNALTVAGGNFFIVDEAYDASAWNSNLSIPTKNAIRDYLETLTGTTLPATYQPLDSDLTSIAALTTTSYGRGLLELADETALEALLDTLPNLTSIQGRTVTLADAGANAFFGWDDAASAYENLTNAEAKGALGYPTSTTDNTVPRFDLTAGNLQTSGVTIDDSNGLSVPGASAFASSMTVAFAASSTAGLFLPAAATYGKPAIQAVTSGFAPEELYLNPATGPVYIGAGPGQGTVVVANIVFPSTAVPSADANCLDDYEEGTFTPTIIQTGVAPTTMTYTTQQGHYTKIGNIVRVSIDITVNAFTLGSGTGNITLGTLPFAGYSGQSQMCAYTQGVDWAAGSHVIGFVPGSGATAIQLYTVADNAGATAIALSGLAAGDSLSAAGVYTAAA